MIALNGINAREQWDGFKKTWNASGPQVVKPYLVDFAHADAFMTAIMAASPPAGTAPGTVAIGRHQCPENPSLYAMECECEYVAETDITNNDRPHFIGAIVTVTYGILPWDFKPNDDPGGVNSFEDDANPGQSYPYATQEIDFGGEFLTLPKGSLVFRSDSKPVDFPVGRWQAHATLRFVRHYVPFFPAKTILSYLNRINATTFLGQPKGTIRFAGAKTKRIANSDGTRSQDVELIFEYRETDWNKFIRPDTLDFDFVSDKTLTKLPYAYWDLNTILYSQSPDSSGVAGPIAGAPNP